MPTHPTLQDARAALDAAQAALDAATAAQTAAATKAADARQVFYRARRAVEEARDREVRNTIARDRRKAQALAKAHGISIEKDGDLYWVLGPWSTYGDGDGCPGEASEGWPADRQVRVDPCEGDHIAYDWSEVLHNVGIYVADLALAQAEHDRI